MIRRGLFEICGRSGLWRALRAGSRLARGTPLPVLTYHRVCDFDPRTPFDPDTISATPRDFARQLRFLKRHFTPISSSHVVRWKRDGRPLPPNPVVITFDDGYRDNCTVALPRLREAGVPADFFICPGNIQQRRPFWWDLISYCIRKSSLQRAVLQYPKLIELDLTSPECRESARRRLLRVVKHTPGLEIEKLLDRLQEATGVEPDPARAADELLMTWDDVRALRDAGMGVGSHTWTHRVLTKVDGAEARRQLTRSRGVLEEQLGRPVRTLAYPVGGFDRRVIQQARAAGYELAYAYGGGVSRLPSADLLALRRLAVERHVTLPYLKAMLSAPRLTA